MVYFLIAAYCFGILVGRWSVYTESRGTTDAPSPSVENYEEWGEK